MRTETITYLKEHANQLELNEPLIITQNGRARYVVQSIEDFEYQQETVALLKLLTIAERANETKTLSIDEAFSE